MVVRIHDLPGASWLVSFSLLYWFASIEGYAAKAVCEVLWIVPCLNEDRKSNLRYI